MALKQKRLKRVKSLAPHVGLSGVNVELALAASKPNGGRPSRKETQAREKLVLSLLEEGNTPAQISQLTGLARPGIAETVRRLRRKNQQAVLAGADPATLPAIPNMRMSPVGATDQILAGYFSTLDRVEQAAWVGWKRSCQGIPRDLLLKEFSPELLEDIKSRPELYPGDPQFLKILIEVTMKRAQLRMENKALPNSAKGIQITNVIVNRPAGNDTPPSAPRVVNP